MEKKEIHILLVEDNEGDIVLTTEALEEGKLNNSISVVRDGWQAIQYLEKEEGYEDVETPDLILLDINLPKINGHKVLKHIKTSGHLKQIPVIMLTTSSDEIDINKSYKNHSNCYITKPIDINDFLDVISTIENFWISIVQFPKTK
ncbi:response regulator [Gracilimonas mengyeensis]|uniref:CheY chemotaxis protein or a CheY-like REC (Receiver) domain n=1 Tax=Gracilimonas mengyeensis TaxID=1302730 RepID=A0A521AM97_9BACT|nr:response regulator [Gracilimonas mengyeensis]SMO35923.1 CheY chemotaxis protein or a CheY-like REC (receiver) domain [Gracilimonas mengyeensis]